MAYTPLTGADDLEKTFKLTKDDGGNWTISIEDYKELAEGWDAVIERTGALLAGWPSDVMAAAVLLGDLFVGALKAVAPVLV